jgi:hypothetical protein
MATTNAAVVRGSSEISEEMLGKPQEVSREAIRQLLKVSRSQGVKLQGWWIRGKPAIDVIHGVITVQPDRAGDVFNQLVMIDDLRLKVEGFPLGIIDPDVIQMHFSNQGGF